MNSLLGIEGKNILIVGATAGIIRPLVPQLQSLGANLACTARDGLKIKSLFPGLDEKSIFEVDISNISENLVKEMPSFDGIIFSIGTLNQKPFKFLSSEDLKITFEVNFMSQINFLRSLVANNKLANNSSIVFLSSLASHKSDIGLTAYSASKGAIDACVRPLAIELGKRKKIRVNSLCPAFVKTELSETSKNIVGEDNINKHLSQYLLGDITTDDVCGYVLFLLSDLSRKVTGQNLILDSGYLC